MWSRIAQIFTNDQWGRDTIRLVQGDEAAAMVKRAEGILEDSMRVLASHERVLSEGEFNTFSIKHRQLVLKVVEIKRQAEEQQDRGVFSASTAGRDSESIDRSAFRIFRQTQIYHQDLLTASRRAQIAEEERFLGRLQPEVSQGESLTDQTTCYTIVASSSSTESETDTDDTTAANRQPYAAVIHVLPETDSEGSTSDSVSATLILKHGGKMAVLHDPNRYSRSEANKLNGSILEMARAGAVLLGAADPTDLQGYEVTESRQEEVSWVDSFVHGLARLGVGIGADMV